MTKKLARLAERRKQLIEQAAEQRITLAQNIKPFHSAIALADTGMAAVRYVKQHPVLMVGGAMLLGLLRPTRFGKWLQSGWVVLEIARKLSGWLNKR
jgi:hypothetical protein